MVKLSRHRQEPAAVDTPTDAAADLKLAAERCAAHWNRRARQNVAALLGRAGQTPGVLICYPECLAAFLLVGCAVAAALAIRGVQELNTGA